MSAMTYQTFTVTRACRTTTRGWHIYHSTLSALKEGGVTLERAWEVATNTDSPTSRTLDVVPGFSPR